MYKDITRTHYDRIANKYNEHWSCNPDFMKWITGHIVRRLRIGPEDQVVDVGCGTGLYTRYLAELARDVTCVDPSAPMLEQLPSNERLIPIQASAEDLVSGQVSLPHRDYDAILLNGVVHHLADPSRTMSGLVALLKPGGRLLVVMRPPRINFPLFVKALKLFEELQPDPGAIAGVVRSAGLRTEILYEEFSVKLATELYVRMVRGRYMSLLSSFTDAELGAGIIEIQKTFTGPHVEFIDRMAFVLGEKA